MRRKTNTIKLTFIVINLKTKSIESSQLRRKQKKRSKDASSSHLLVILVVSSTKYVLFVVRVTRSEVVIRHTVPSRLLGWVDLRRWKKDIPCADLVVTEKDREEYRTDKQVDGQGGCH